MNARSGRSFSLALAALSSGFAGLASAPVAHATCRPSAESVLAHTVDADAAYQACRWRERTGVEAWLQAGLGMGFDPSAEVLIYTRGGDAQGQRNGPGIAVNVGLGGRVIPAVSVGAHLYFQYSPAYGLRETAVTRTSLGGSTDYTPTGGSTNMMGVGVYGRVYLGTILGSRRFDPWIGAGFDFASPAWVATSVHTRATSNINPLTGTPLTAPSISESNGTIMNTVVAIGVPLGVGLDMNVNPDLAIGLLAQVSLWVPYGRCGNAVSGNAVNCSSDLYPVAPTFFLGAEARFLSPF